MCLADQPEDLRHLRTDLVEGAEVVCVVERDRTHPGQPAEHAGPLGPVHAAQFGDPQRQVPPGSAPGPVDQRVMRAERRPQHELVVRRQPHRWEHVVGEEVEMAGKFEEFPFTQWRGEDVLVTGLAFEFPDALLDGMPGCRSGRQPERQPRTGQWIGGEEAQLSAEPAVVDHDALLVRVRPGGDRRPERRRGPGAIRPGASLTDGSVRHAGVSRRRGPRRTVHAARLRRTARSRTCIRLAGSRDAPLLCAGSPSSPRTIRRHPTALADRGEVVVGGQGWRANRVINGRESKITVR